MIYTLFGWWVRLQACRMAAQVMHGRGFGTDVDGPTPRIWSLTVFFEQYILTGAEGTCDEFGPKEPTLLKIVAEKS